MKTWITFLALICFALSVHAAELKKKKVIYEYKKFEKFDFDEIGVEGDSGSPGDLSVAPGPRKTYDNRLPERKDFNQQMRKAASGIR